MKQKAYSLEDSRYCDNGYRQRVVGTSRKSSRFESDSRTRIVESQMRANPLRLVPQLNRAILDYRNACARAAAEVDAAAPAERADKLQVDDPISMSCDHGSIGAPEPGSR